MTFCLGMRVDGGLVGIADTRVTSGSECITAKKVRVYHQPRSSIFLMTSGLRSIRDKALTYFDEVMEDEHFTQDRLYKVVNLFAEQLRRVAAEDRPSLKESGLKFDFHAILGGQCEHDREHKLYLIYPEANWVEVGPGTPYTIIGASGYGKPVLDRTLHFTDSLSFALKVGCLAFDSTRISAADVNFPIDVLLYERDSFQCVEHRFEAADMAHTSDWWQDQLRRRVNELPSEWIDTIMDLLPSAQRRITPRTG